VLLVWQRHDDNEWARAINLALGDAAQAARPGSDPFSLGAADATADILEGAGFDDVHEPVLYGHDLDAALAFVLGFRTRARPSRPSTQTRRRVRSSGCATC
jgi:hypothetical protein